MAAKRGFKILLVVLGCLLGIVILIPLVLYLMGGTTIEDPFVGGIDVIDAPFTAPATFTWRIEGAPASDTALYIGEQLDIPPGVTPEQTGLTRVEARTATVDGKPVYQADVPAGARFVHVYADINGPKWSQEYEMVQQ
jgi:hypothetical protein